MQFQSNHTWLGFAKEHLDCQICQWHLCFSQVWAGVGDVSNVLLPANHGWFGGGSLMVWARMAYLWKAAQLPPRQKHVDNRTSGRVPGWDPQSHCVQDNARPRVWSVSAVPALYGHWFLWTGLPLPQTWIQLSTSPSTQATPDCAGADWCFNPGLVGDTSGDNWSHHIRSRQRPCRRVIQAHGGHTHH